MPTPSRQLGAGVGPQPASGIPIGRMKFVAGIGDRKRGGTHAARESRTRFTREGMPGSAATDAQDRDSSSSVIASVSCRLETRVPVIAVADRPGAVSIEVPRQRRSTAAAAGLVPDLLVTRCATTHRAAVTRVSPEHFAGPGPDPLKCGLPMLERSGHECAVTPIGVRQQRAPTTSLLLEPPGGRSRRSLRHRLEAGLLLRRPGNRSSSGNRASGMPTDVVGHRKWSRRRRRGWS